ncbi:MAG: hypothetical protein ACTSP4_15975 [Candidatus Hodarchaeales archaeon]
MTSPGPIFGVLLVIDGIIAIITGLIIIKRDPNYDLNRLAATIMFSFSMFFISEGIIYILPLSMLGTFNLLRYVTMLAAGVSATLAAISGLYIWKGKMFISQLRILVPIIVAGAVGTVVSIIDARVVYDDVADAITFENSTIGIIGQFVIPIIMVLIAITGYVSSLRTVEKSEPLYRKLLALSVALIMIIVAIGLYAVLESAGLREGILGMSGHILYTGASLILIYTFYGK